MWAWMVGLGVARHVERKHSMYQICGEKINCYMPACSSGQGRDAYVQGAGHNDDGVGGIMMPMSSVCRCRKRNPILPADGFPDHE